MCWPVRFSTSRIFALFLFAIRCLAADHQDGDIVLKDGFVFVNAIVNGHGPFRMLVDTGTTTTLLGPGAAAEAGLKFDHRIVLTSLGDEKPLPATSTGELQVGSARATGVEIAVAAIGHVRKIDPATQGILGQSFLSRSAVGRTTICYFNPADCRTNDRSGVATGRRTQLAPHFGQRRERSDPEVQ